jgi:DNA gyrase subunit A
MLISNEGTMIKIPVEDVRRMGRSTQGVIVMRLRGEEEHVSSLAPVVESETPEIDADESDEAGEPAAEPVVEDDEKLPE